MAKFLNRNDRNIKHIHFPITGCWTAWLNIDVRVEIVILNHTLITDMCSASRSSCLPVELRGVRTAISSLTDNRHVPNLNISNQLHQMAADSMQWKLCIEFFYFFFGLHFLSKTLNLNASGPTEMVFVFHLVVHAEILISQNNNIGFVYMAKVMSNPSLSLSILTAFV